MCGTAASEAVKGVNAVKEAFMLFVITHGGKSTNGGNDVMVQDISFDCVELVKTLSAAFCRGAALAHDEGCPARAYMNEVANVIDRLIPHG